MVRHADRDGVLQRFAEISSQGHRLVRITEFAEEAKGIPCEAAQCGSDFLDSVASEPVQRCVAHGSQVLCGMTAEDRAAIFSQDVIPHVVQPVFDRSPVIA
jgi:hypothetical protein